MEEQSQILLADHDPAYRADLSRFLLGQGFKVLPVEKVSAALNLIQNERIDVVILAADMPEMQGHEVVPIIKAMAPKTPVIITAREDPHDLEVKVRQSPIFFYHVKSFGPEELILAVRNALDRSAR